MLQLLVVQDGDNSIIGVGLVCGIIPCVTGGAGQPGQAVDHFEFHRGGEVIFQSFFKFKIGSALPAVEEDLLHDLFCFEGIAEAVTGDNVQYVPVAIVDGAESGLLAGFEACYELEVIQLTVKGHNKLEEGCSCCGRKYFYVLRKKNPSGLRNH